MNIRVVENAKTATALPTKPEIPRGMWELESLLLDAERLSGRWRWLSIVRS
jgi:hypothetical protein